MRYVLLFTLLVMAGCTDSEENASMNLRKGDEFMAKGEYEIAEYYYDKVPEESVLFKTVERRRKEMEKSAPKPVAEKGKSTVQQRQGVFILKESHVLQLGKMPIHTITVQNATSKRLNVMELEFIYRNEMGVEVQKMTTMVNASMDAGEEKELDKIAPGMLNQKFSTVSVVIKRTMLF